MRLYRQLLGEYASDDSMDEYDATDDVADIEAEAEAAALERVRAGVKGLRQIDSVRLDRLDLRREIDDSPLLVLNDVLRLLEGRVVEAVPRSLGEAGDR